MSSRLLLVVPCYNEEEILRSTNQKLLDYFEILISKNLIDSESKICYVNDGSRDKTWTIIEELSGLSSRILGVKLSKNFGHQNALLAGLFEFRGQFDCYISIDADLQDDINAIEAMILKYREGASVVYGVREDRSKDSFFKRFTAEFFYKLMFKMGIPLVFNHADFRLIDNQVLEQLEHYNEVNMFLRGIIPTIGFKSEKVFYSRLEREAGETKYPLKKMLTFAWNGITSFSTFPMRLVLWFGIFNFVVAIFVGIYTLISLYLGKTVSGWTSTVLPMAFFSGSNMIAIGLIGEYIGKIYEEVKSRPRFIVEKTVGTSKS
ncbi:MAG: glycosyltransferase family 2 protein [Bacteroidetes bacterium]|nr:glycosyltransferase family 2 protein [Bacteroidota bacterium]